MTDKTIELDQHRGMAAQKATELRRLLADVEANEKALGGQSKALRADIFLFQSNSLMGNAAIFIFFPSNPLKCRIKHVTLNQRVQGSSPCAPTNKFNMLVQFSGYNKSLLRNCAHVYAHIFGSFAKANFFH
jgi:hypothetical protein